MPLSVADPAVMVAPWGRATASRMSSGGDPAVTMGARIVRPGTAVMVAPAAVGIVFDAGGAALPLVVRAAPMPPTTSTTAAMASTMKAWRVLGPAERRERSGADGSDGPDRRVARA